MWSWWKSFQPWLSKTNSFPDFSFLWLNKYPLSQFELGILSLAIKKVLIQKLVSLAFLCIPNRHKEGKNSHAFLHFHPGISSPHSHNEGRFQNHRLKQRSPFLIYLWPVFFHHSLRFINLQEDIRNTAGSLKRLIFSKVSHHVGGVGRHKNEGQFGN